MLRSMLEYSGESQREPRTRNCPTESKRDPRKQRCDHAPSSGTPNKASQKARVLQKAKESPDRHNYETGTAAHSSLLKLTKGFVAAIHVRDSQSDSQPARAAIQPAVDA